MTISVFDLFKIGVGPSSSHTVGPMRAARQFMLRLKDEELLEQTARVRAELFGSLGATGKGHASDTAVILGLEGEQPDLVDPDTVDERLARIRESEMIRLLGTHAAPFQEKEDLILNRRRSLPFHPNGMQFTAYDSDGKVLLDKRYYSVGGGFVVDESATETDRIKEDDTPQPY
ncbi:MAG: L-serine ammonia-lyase, partial [Chloroflexota bacterium]|nr:L-serine ammonia-lyase [Chloroflexota bacterium]